MTRGSENEHRVNQPALRALQSPKNNKFNSGEQLSDSSYCRFAPLEEEKF